MTVGREIRTKINSIRNTQKITRAMQMVAASKMKKVQSQMLAARPYADKVLQVVAHLANAHPEYKHPFMVARDIKRVGYVVVTTDRGLCGALNIALLREVVKELKTWEDKKVECDLCLVGSKADAFFRRYGGNVVAKALQPTRARGFNDLIGAGKIMLDLYRSGRIDALFFVFNKFVTTVTQEPHIQQLLPLVSTDAMWKVHYWDYLYEPDAEELLNTLLDRYLESQVYLGVVENDACEQAARMVAMKNATDNAGQVIDDLLLIYHKARQSAITTEITEMIGGAEALGV